MTSRDRGNATGSGTRMAAEPRPAGIRRGRAIAFNILLALTSLLVTFGGLEVALRVYHGKLFDFTSQLPPPPNRAETPAADYDERLGWVPRPGLHVREENGERWNITEDGLRSNGSPIPEDGRPILTIGDSFTFGDEVEDDETWPAQLESLLGVPVLNGGVFAYGVDQAYMRGRALIDRYDPEIVILALISSDISRAELSFYSAWKPYFEFENGELELRNVPVPESGSPVPRHAGVRKALSYSYVLSAVLRRVADSWWTYGRLERVHHDGDRVAVELLDSLNAFARSRNSRFVAVALGTNGRIGGNMRIEPVVQALRERGITVLDLLPEVEDLPDDSLSAMFLSRGHYTPRMNGIVAARIAAFLEDGG